MPRHVRLLLSLSATLLAALPAVSHAATDARTRGLLDEAQRLGSARSWEAADSVLALALARAEAAAPPDSAAMALALYLRGNGFFSRVLLKDPAGAASLERALAICGRMARPDTLAWIRAQSLLARLYFEQDRAADALAGEEAARRLCTPTLAGSDSARAETWLHTGRYYRRLHDVDRALDALERSRALRESALGADHPMTAATLDEIGALHLQTLRFEEAREAFDRAIAIIERTRGPEDGGLVPPLGHLATLELDLGDVAGSIETLSRAIAIQTRLDGADSPRLVPQRHSLAIRLIEFGDYPAAFDELCRLLPIAETNFGPASTRTRDVLAMAGAAAVLKGDSSAAGYLRRARAMTKPGPMNGAAMETWVERWYAALEQRSGDPAGARATVDSALARVAPKTLPPVLETQLLGIRSEACRALRDSAGVRAALARLDSISHGDVGVWIAEAEQEEAKALAWLGDDAGAWGHAMEAEARERERLRNNLRTLPDRRGLQFAGQLAGPLDLLLGLAMPLDAARVEPAWDRLVRWRGMVGAEIASRRLPREAAGDTALVSLHARWIEERRRVAQLEVAAYTWRDSANVRRLEDGRRSADEIERRYAVAAAARGLARDTAEVTLAAVRAALGEGQALVSLFEISPGTDTARVAAFVMAGAGAPAQRVDLGPLGALDPALEAWRAALATPPAPGRERAAERELRRLGGEVRSRVWDPLRERAGLAREVVIVSEGELATLPWGALPDHAGRYLAESGPAVTTLAAERDLLEPPAPAGGKLLAVGDPDFSGGLPALSAAPALATRGPLADCAPRASLEFAALPGARAEVEDVSRLWAASHGEAATRVGAEATEAAIKAEAPGCRVLHLATHGVVWGDSCTIVHERTRGVGGVAELASAPARRARAPRRPAAPAPHAGPAVPSPWKLGRRVWLALAGANRARTALDENEGLLTAEEVASLDLGGLDWVVLSACQSGVAEAWPREGSLGMQRAFRLAGARCVIASGWAVTDESTREWMAALYRARLSGARATDAMRAADREVLAARRASGRSTHPFYWAAFTSTGR